MELPKRVCVSSKYLNEGGPGKEHITSTPCKNMVEWLFVEGPKELVTDQPSGDRKHCLITRSNKRPYTYRNGFSFRLTKDSPWHNPYKVGMGKDKYTLEKSLSKYRKYLEEKLRENPLFLDPLLKFTEIGCFCKPGERCHGDIIVEKLTLRKEKGAF